MSDAKAGIIKNAIIVDRDRLVATVAMNGELQRALAESKLREARLAHMIGDLLTVMGAMATDGDVASRQAVSVARSIGREVKEMQR